MVGTALSSVDEPGVGRLRVTLLGPFRIMLDQRTAGPWYRPAARRLCELVMLTPSHRLGREAARDLLFPKLAPTASAKALSTALSLAREALAPLGQPASELLRADRTTIWVDDEVLLDIDAEAHQEALRSALGMEPGAERDGALFGALQQDGVLLDEEPYADWAVAPREALQELRQRARLELARDRARGFGRSQPHAVIDAWESCLAHDAASEEAAASLIRVYSAKGQRQLAAGTFDRCRTALEALGLSISPALEEARRAIGEVIGATSGPGLTGAVPGPADHSVMGHAGTEERRPISVLFAELSRVSASAHGQDPEDVRRVVGSALAGAIAEIEGLGGTVTSVSGAGLAAIFGAPEAHEDDPERAVRAGFRMQSASAVAGDGAESTLLSLRIGIETGGAVVGPLWSGAGTGYGAAGEVIEIAATLQSTAKPGSVLVGPVTTEAAASAFEWGPTEEVPVKSGGKPLKAVYLDRPRVRRAGTWGEGGPARVARLIGRPTELSLIDKALREAMSGAGSVLFLVGEPGLGKTRLVQECRKRFMAWVGAGTGRLPLWLEGRCASYASSTPYGLYRQLLSAWIGVSPEEGEEVVRPALERAVKAVFPGQADHLGFLGHMLGLRGFSGDPRITRLSPEGLQRATFASVSELLAQLTTRGPTVLAVEDLHWADPTSLRLTEELAALASRSPLLLLATRRPEPDAGVPALESALEQAPNPFRRVELAPLTERFEQELAESILHGEAGPGVVQAIRTHVDGNPLFLEERFSSLVESGALVKHGDSWSLTGTPTSDVPQALERMIRARVDRLPLPCREAITAASVLGPEFSSAALEAVSDLGDELPATVRELCDARLLSLAREVPEPAFRFRHALIQEATYRGVLSADRRRLHARAAWGLEEASADRLDQVAAVLGHHFAEAGEIERAVRYFEMAGAHAFARFGVDEAISSYGRAVQIVDRSPAGLTLSQTAVNLREALSEVQWRCGRFDDARRTLHEALELIIPSRRLQAAQLQARLGRVEAETLNYQAAEAAFDAADELLGDIPDDAGTEWVDVWLEVQVDGRANMYIWANRLEQAVEVLERARPVAESYGSAGRRGEVTWARPWRAVFEHKFSAYLARRARFRIDAEILAGARAAVRMTPLVAGEYNFAYGLGDLGVYLLWHGDLDEAQEKLEAALVLAERTDDRYCQLWCQGNLLLVGVRRHDLESVRALSQKTAAAVEGRFSPWTNFALHAGPAWVAWKEGRTEDAAFLARQVLERWREVRPVYYYKGLCLWPLASVSLASGDVATALDSIEEVLRPDQVRLPDALESVLQSARVAWERADSAAAAVALNEALGLACELGYA